jgi:hypothetical protein
MLIRDELVADLRLWAKVQPEAADAIEQLHTENLEQARLLGMSAERELKLLAEIEQLKKQIALLQAQQWNELYD